MGSVLCGVRMPSPSRGLKPLFAPFEPTLFERRENAFPVTGIETYSRIERYAKARGRENAFPITGIETHHTDRTSHILRGRENAFPVTGIETHKAGDAITIGDMA